MRKLRIVLGDLSYHNNANSGSLYVPLNIGFLASYVKELYGADVEVSLHKDPKMLLDDVRSRPADIIGLSFYYWNTALNHLTTRLIRRELGREPFIVWGGPSVDSEPSQLAHLFTRFPEVDFFVMDEGEQGFAAIAAAVLGGLGPSSSRPAMGGVAFRAGDGIAVGAKVGLSTDLSKIPSPYLNGTLDAFLDGEYLPLLQTSRLCPYTCAFCVSGKNTGKLRSFSIDRVKEELDFIARRYRDRPNHRMYIVDENFGILNRDADVAAYIRDLSETVGYPQKLFYYNDKKFGPTSRAVHELIGDMCFHGLTLSLQSDNPETLKAIKRRNLSPEALCEAIQWGKAKGLPVTTELIVGLPGDSRHTFVELLDRCDRMGFDVVQTYNLIVLDGIELNRPSERARHGIKTKFRPLPGHFLYLEGEFCAESEEVVTETNDFNFDDFCFFRVINMFYYAVTHYRLHHLFFRFLTQNSISMAKFAQRFVELAEFADDLPPAYQVFFEDFWQTVMAELFGSAEEVSAAMRGHTSRAGGKPRDPIKINPHFGRRLIRDSAGWVRSALRTALASMIADHVKRDELLAQADILLDLGARERVVGSNLLGCPPITFPFDIVGWIASDFRQPLEWFQGKEGVVVLQPSGALRDICAAMPAEITADQMEESLYEMLGQFRIDPRDLLHEIKSA